MENISTNILWSDVHVFDHIQNDAVYNNRFIHAFIIHYAYPYTVYFFFAVFYITVVLVTCDVIGKRRGQNAHPPDGPKLLTFSVDPPVSHSPRLVVPVDTNTDLRLGCRARNVEEPIQVSVTRDCCYDFVKILWKSHQNFGNYTASSW